MTRRACVLLSTYNGNRYLPEQIDSLLSQRGCEMHVVARDDGSSDSTLKRLKEYERKLRGCVTVISGGNVGAARSFLTLLRNAPTGFDAYLFADQDDIWDNNKVEIALEALATEYGPALYCSRVRYIDSLGRVIGESPRPGRVGLENALVECVAVGCTMALNVPAASLINQATPARPIMHDWWCYAVVAGLGKVIHDDAARMSYRLHGGNLVGQKPSRLGAHMLRLRKRLARTSATVLRSAQARELLQLYGGQMQEAERQLVEDFVAGKHSLTKRLKLLWGQPLRRGDWMDMLILNCQILLNDY